MTRTEPIKNTEIATELRDEELERVVGGWAALGGLMPTTTTTSTSTDTSPYMTYTFNTLHVSG